MRRGREEGLLESKKVFEATLKVARSITFHPFLDHSMAAMNATCYQPSATENLGFQKAASEILASIRVD
jgi:hypothetical protein